MKIFVVNFTQTKGIVGGTYAMTNEPRRRKPDFLLCENKSADQLCSNCSADQRLCFRDTDSTVHLLFKLRNFKLLAFFFCDGTCRFVSEVVGNPEDRVSLS